MEKKKKRRYLGVDIGSTTYKAVLLSEEGEVVNTTYQRTQPVDSGRLACTGRCSGCGHCNLGAVKTTTENFLKESGVTPEDIAATAVTGSQIVEDTSRFIKYDFQVSEDVCPRSRRGFLPDVDAIIPCAPRTQSEWYMQGQARCGLDDVRVCAAGTGSYLDSVAAKLGLMRGDRRQGGIRGTTEFSSVCAVSLATSINKFKNRIPLGDLLAGASRRRPVPY